jgi:Tfp pilus assembly protein PilF
MRWAILFLAGRLALAQTADPAYASLKQAYQALQTRDYDTAIAELLKAIQIAPARASIRKDLAYTYLKIGENALARDQFGEALRIQPDDVQAALEYAFLCYDTKQQVEARRIFDRLRKAGNTVAAQAFENIDAPLRAGIARWKDAIANGADNFSAHFELATLAEQRDELQLAAEQYERAWRILPDRRSVLVDLGRVWKALDQTERANAALLAASRGGEPRAAELAHELLPHRYPYVSEFRQALNLDPANVELRRELAYLLLRMDREAEAEAEFQYLTNNASGDLLSTTQLGFLLLARGDAAAAMPLFERVLAGSDQELANRVRAVLRLQQVLLPRSEALMKAVDAKQMAERSIKAGYIKDAVKYLHMAHEAQPDDCEVMLKLGWAYNLLHQDDQAVQWFDLARHSSDPRIASEAQRSWKNLRPATERLVTTVWMLPLFSTRWHDLFSYGQIKTELRTRLFFKPYVSTRFVGDTRVTMGITPQYLSESSFILALGVASGTWHGIMGWAEAGTAVGYVRDHMRPDYRGGISIVRSWGKSLAGEPGWFAASNTDGVFLSCFGNDLLAYQQMRAGYTAGPKPLRIQLYANLNLTIDSQREGWANFVESGPGLRFRSPMMPPSMFVSIDAMRGAYLIHGSYPQPNFRDLRVGIWYAFTR